MCEIIDNSDYSSFISKFGCNVFACFFNYNVGIWYFYLFSSCIDNRLTEPIAPSWGFFMNSLPFLAILFGDKFYSKFFASFDC